MKIKMKKTFLNGNQIVYPGQLAEVDEYRGQQLIRSGLATMAPEAPTPELATETPKPEQEPVSPIKKKRR